MPADDFIPVFFQAVQGVFSALDSAMIFTGISALTILLLFVGFEILVWAIRYISDKSMPDFQPVSYDDGRYAVEEGDSYGIDYFDYDYNDRDL